MHVEREMECECESIVGEEGAKRKIQGKELEPMLCFFPLVAFLYRFRGKQIWCLLFLLLFAFFPITLLDEDRCETWEITEGGKGLLTLKV